MEKAREFHAPLYMCFVDLKKAYDSVNRKALWSVLQKRYHFPTKVVRILEALHQGTTGAVRAYGRVSGEFPIANGVRQGDVLAPTLFNLFLDSVICMALRKHPANGLTVLFNPAADLVGCRKLMHHRTQIPDLDYADDMCLVSDSMDKLEEMLMDMDESCSEMGLTISARKTKIMAVLPTPQAGQQQEQPRQVQLQRTDNTVDVVEEFEYLGSTVASDCGLDKEVSARIRKASSSFRSLSRVLWYQKKIKTETKMRMFKAAIIPTLMYGSEAWAPLAHQVKRLQSFVMRCLRIILGLSVRQQKRNTVIRTEANMETVESMLRRRRLRWLGHVARMGTERIPRQLLVCKPEGGKRTAGGQKLRWADVVSKDLKGCKVDKDWREIAQDRCCGWTAVVDKMVEDLNRESEEVEKRKKDERKQRRERELFEAHADLQCKESGCTFQAQNKAGLVNHQRQKHRQSALKTLTCPHCDGQYKKQGLKNHMKFCRRNPTRQAKCSGWRE